MVGVAGVVVDHRQVASALGNQAVDQFIGNTGRAKAADQYRGAVFHAGQRLGYRVGNLVDHGMRLLEKLKSRQMFA
ncbi:hypothetical protein D3C78_1459640 [compost metagenome]